MVKIAIVDVNETYLKRLHDYWSKTYGGGAVLVYVFSSWEQLLERVKTEKPDIVLVNNQLEPDLDELPRRTLKIYLLPGKKSGEINGIPALPKNGNADELYAKIMELYEIHLNIDHVTIPGQILFFTSPSGGSGTSSCAVGCGKYLASLGKKVLYINLENISAEELMLDGEPGQGMEELFYLCRTNRKNLSLSIDSVIGTDSSGLKYVAHCKNPMELKEMSTEDMKNMISIVTEKGAFDYIIIDRGFSLEQITDELIAIAKKIILVTEMTPMGKRKMELLRIFLQEADYRGVQTGNKVRILYNKSRHVESDREILGGVGIKTGDERQITSAIGREDLFQLLLEEDI